MVDHNVIAVSALVIGGHRHGSRQGGADGCTCGDRQVHAGMTPPLSRDRVNTVAKLRGDHTPPVLPNRRAEAVRPDERHISPLEAAASPRIAVADEAVDALRVAPLVLCDLHAHGGVEILIDRLQILNGHGHRVGFFLLCVGPVLMFHGDSPGALLIGDEAVREFPAVLLAGAVRAEVQSIKKGLDADLVKAVFSFCQFIDIFNGSIQEIEARAHLLNVGPVLIRGLRRDRAAVKAQLHNGEVVAGGTRTQSAQKGNQQDHWRENRRQHPTDFLSGVFISQGEDGRLDCCGSGGAHKVIPFMEGPSCSGPLCSSDQYSVSSAIVSSYPSFFLCFSAHAWYRSRSMPLSSRSFAMSAA